MTISLKMSIKQVYLCINVNLYVNNTPINCIDYVLRKMY